MRDLMITENVKNLLLNLDFLELVFGGLADCLNDNSRKSESINSMFKSYTSAEMLSAKYILEHLHEDLGLASETDLEEVRKRIRRHLNRQK